MIFYVTVSILVGGLWGLLTQWATGSTPWGIGIGVGTGLIALGAMLFISGATRINEAIEEAAREMVGD